MKQKIIAIVGPTCSGKTTLAIEAARRLGGEVVSADSRQVYRGLDIGTGKATPEEMRGVPHHLLDIADPRERYTVAHYRTDALRAIAQIHARAKLPIIAGGTGQYIDAVLYAKTIPEVPPNEDLRATLERKSGDELFAELCEKDPTRAQTIERYNKRRLVRALEIVAAIGAVPAAESAPARFEHLIIYLEVSNEVLRAKIRERLLARLDSGMLDEARRLHNSGLSWERMEELGLEYRWMKRHLTGECSYEEMLTRLERAIFQYARRQKTWWRSRTDITRYAYDIPETALKHIATFLKP